MTKEHVQHFMDDRSSPIVDGRKSWLLLDCVIPESFTQEQG
jgi:hypothetical protein